MSRRFSGGFFMPGSAANRINEKAGNQVNGRDSGALGSSVLVDRLDHTGSMPLR